jgi:radical SAM protein with 4Fe4S-binding SPASM domain
MAEVQLPTFNDGDCPELHMLRFESYRIFYNLDEAKSIAFALVSLRGDALEWAVYFTEDENITFSQFKNAFIERFKIHKNKFAIKQELRARIQGDNESIADYMRSIKLLCLKLNPAMTEAEKLGYAIEGLADKYLLLIGNPKTMEELEETVTRLQGRQHMLSTRKTESSASNFNFLIESLSELKKEITELKIVTQPAHAVAPQEIAQAVGEIFGQQISSAFSRISDLLTSTLAQTLNTATATKRSHRRRRWNQENISCSYCGIKGHCEMRCRAKKYNEKLPKTGKSTRRRRRKRRRARRNRKHKNTQHNWNAGFGDPDNVVYFNQQNTVAIAKAIAAIDTQTNKSTENLHASAATRALSDSTENENCAPSSTDGTTITIKRSAAPEELACVASSNDLMRAKIVVKTESNVEKRNKGKTNSIVRFLSDKVSMMTRENVIKHFYG